MKIQNITGMPVKDTKCSTCPFGPNGNQQIREMVERRILTEASQTCHSTGVAHGRQDTHLCRGARDFQLQVFRRIGVISAPTDEAWAKAVARIPKTTP